MQANFAPVPFCMLDPAVSKYRNALKTLQIFLLTPITDCNSMIAYCDMRLGEKIKYLREVEGALRGLNRDLSQQELARLIEKELGKSISQSYLSQIESGARPHLTNSTRMLLARFFKVHPGYLVDDPEGYEHELVSDIGAIEDKLDLWLISGAERFARDPDLHRALLTTARHADSRMCLVLLGTILENPGLAERLMEVLKQPPPANGKSRRRS
jgi:transcriptional regulator with XRE-family HTH domain